VDGWQIQCCGTPFHVGDAVEWTLTGNKDVEWLENVVGPETAHMIDFSEEHHGGLPADAPVRGGSYASTLFGVASRLRPDAGGQMDSRSRSIAASSCSLPWIFGPVNQCRAETSHQIPAKPSTTRTAIGV
jgi:hypothetical protein